MPPPEIQPLFSAEQVQARIGELVTRLYRDYADSPLTILCIDEGAGRFVAALEAQLSERRVRLEVHRVRARRTQGTELGAVSVSGFDPEALEAKDVLVVDDIADQGCTLRAVLDLVGMVETRSVHTAVLVDKAGDRRDDVELHYVGFQVERGWVVGFGMDLDGEYRDLDYIGVVEDARF